MKCSALLVLLAFLLLASHAVEASKKKRRHGDSSAAAAVETDDDVQSQELTGGLFERMQQVREKTTPNNVKHRFVADARMQLQEFVSNNGEFAPELGPTYQVTDEDRRHFHEQGFVLLRNVFTPEEISYYREVILHTMNLDVHYLTKRPGFLRVYNLWDKHKLAEKFILSERLGRVAADLLGADGVRLYQDQTFYKFPGDGESPLHQDNYAAPLASNQASSGEEWKQGMTCTVRHSVCFLSRAAAQLTLGGCVCGVDVCRVCVWCVCVCVWCVCVCVCG
jgi:hypothetical protein